jgi:hypothetical protein
LIEERGRLSPIPDNIDAIVPFGDAEALLRKIVELLNLEGKEFSAAG